MSPKGSPAPRGGRAADAAGAEAGVAAFGDISFETALARLEEIVTRLERGEITLDDSLSAFKEGSGLVRHCLTRLEAAEAAVQQLAEGSAGDPLQPFDVAPQAGAGGDSGTHD